MLEQIVSVTEAQTDFEALMYGIINHKKRIIIEQAGEPQLVILSIADYRHLQPADSGQLDWLALVEQSRQQVAIDLKGQDLIDPGLVIGQMREERDEQLFNLR